MSNMYGLLEFPCLEVAMLNGFSFFDRVKDGILVRRLHNGLFELALAKENPYKS